MREDSLRNLARAQGTLKRQQTRAEPGFGFGGGSSTTPKMKRVPPYDFVWGSTSIRGPLGYSLENGHRHLRAQFSPPLSVQQEAEKAAVVAKEAAVVTEMDSVMAEARAVLGNSMEVTAAEAKAKPLRERVQTIGTADFTVSCAGFGSQRRHPSNQ